MKKQVIAIGGGGMDKNNPLMDLYILAATGKKNPKICFLPTASGDDPGAINMFYALFDRYPCQTSHLSLFRNNIEDIHGFLMEQDAVFVGGGHSKAMMGVWRAFGVDKTLAAAYDNGTVLSGGSAGSVCWFEKCITDSVPGKLTVMDCLGILPASNCPHFSSEERKHSTSYYVKQKEISNVYAADEDAALHFINGVYNRTVSSYKNEFGYVVDDFGEIQKLQTQCLQDKKYQAKYIFDTLTFKDAFKKSAEAEEASGGA